MEKVEIIAEIKELVTELIDDSTIVVTEDSALVGSNGIIDSLNLVELCVKLEDRASEVGFEFEWTSELAMSKSRGVFRSISNLGNEFYNQMIDKK